MNHPHQLHAQAALWSLRAALRLLADRARAEARAIALEAAAAAEPLRSPVWGRRQALGGHGDPTGDAVDHGQAPRANRYAELADEVWGQLSDVAQHLPPSAGDPVDRIGAALPTMGPVALVATRRLLDRIDGRLRRLLHEVDDRQLMPRARCPECGAASLVLRTSAPQSQRVVECTTCDLARTWADLRGRVAA